MIKDTAKSVLVGLTGTLVVAAGVWCLYLLEQAFELRGSLGNLNDRLAAGLVCAELPCGAAEPGEDPLEAAKRELREETGYTADEWIKVAALFANPARQTNRVHCFLARGLRKVGAQLLDESEEITFEFVPQAEVMRQIQQGDFCQALHVASYLLALAKLNGGPRA